MRVEREFRRLAVVNRGESAMRCLNAVAELNREQGAGIRTIALCTEPDRRAWFVREADEAVDLGPATILDPRTGARRQAYLDYEILERGLVASRADAAWVGWGFVAEQADFADLCARLGIVFIGPDGGVMRRLGDKIESKRLAESAGVPVLPWSGGPVDDLDTAFRIGDQIGYPLLVKATAGGGGRGIRKAASSADLAGAFESARAEAGHAFGDPTVFLERQIVAARHIEVQIVADRHGAVWAPGVRDCSVQRRNQKVLEESSSTALSAQQDAEVRAAAIRLCRAAGYANAGTVEFLFEPATGSFMFMEVNARLQVEHPVTELTCGLDLVKLQLHVAAGGRLEGQVPPVSGHAIEVRLNAEDPDNGFTPSPGRIAVFRSPAGPGVRVDTGVAVGDDIAPDYDSMIAKIIGWGRNREEAIGRLSRALAQTTVVVRGGKTNKAFLLALLQHPDVRAGTIDNGWLDRLMASGELLSQEYAGVALLMAATEAYEVDRALAQSAFYASAARGRPVTSAENGRRIQFRYRGTQVEVHVYQLGPRRYRVDTGDRRLDLTVEPLGRYERRLFAFGTSYRIVSVVEGPNQIVEVEGVTHLFARDDGGIVRATSPGVVVSVDVARGDEVASGDRLAVLETMKMESPVVASFAGRVREVMVTANDQVDAGDPLLELEPLADQEESRTAEPVSFFSDLDEASSRPAGGDAGRTVFAKLRSYLLGYDLDAGEAKELFARQGARSVNPAEEPDMLRREDDLLELFADLCVLSQRHPESAADNASVRAPLEYLHTYLRSPERGRDTLPAPFLNRLRRALARYDVPTLDRSPELEEALVWMYRSQARLEEFVPVVVSILDRRLTHSTRLAAAAPDPNRARALLQRLQTATENRYLTVSDLAREVQFRWYDEPLLNAVQAAVYDQMERHLVALSSASDDGNRRAHIDALVACPQPMRGLLLRWYRGARPLTQRALLEAAVRRYYRIRDLTNLTVVEAGEHLLCIADYAHENGGSVHLVAAFAASAQAPSLIAAIRGHLADLPADLPVVVDVHTWQRQELPDADTEERTLRAEIEHGESFGRPVHRVDVTVTAEASADSASTTYRFSWRSDPTTGGSTLREDPLYRHMHPMLAKRLEVWRLSNFTIHRLPSVEDVYLFHGVARDNPADQRLFALAEVRDLTPQRDARGAIVALPLLERMLAECLAAIRGYQSHQDPRKRLFENRVVLYVRPIWNVPPELWRDIAHKLVPAAHGLGLEKLVVRVRLADPETGAVREQVLHMSSPGERGVVLRRAEPDTAPIRPLTTYRQQVLKATRRGSAYPYELLRMLTPPVDAESDFPSGEFTEYDLDETGAMVAVEREYGLNTANLVVGMIRNYTATYPEGMTRVVVVGDPTRSLGSLAEPECRRIIAALDLAEELDLPLEWFTVSSGAQISMDSGTENMDWTAAVLRRLILFTQAGGEVNLVITGINVGAQSYWDAEATMLMHTSGILIMIPPSAMVLTGKQALDFSGGVSAEDNVGIGGYERIMGPNGEAQYWAPDLPAACALLFEHYDYTYRARGESHPRRVASGDPVERDVCAYPHPRVEGSDFTTVGDVFSAAKNPERKKPFDIRAVLRAVTDQDCQPLERWARMSGGAEIAVVWDARIGGIATCLIGLESHEAGRQGFLPIDGPTVWTSGTLFPRSSKKVARAINAASGNRPLVVLANLSGFDGSPESMRTWQLEFGAEIGRAIVNFSGPIVFVVISRYHGGAFVVFSKRLSTQLEVAAVEGSFASVIGGAPAAATVFAPVVNARTRTDSRVVELTRMVDAAAGARSAGRSDTELQRLRMQLRELTATVRSEKLGEVAEEFDAVHSIQRAQQVGSVDRIIAPSALRPYIVDALERRMAVDPSGVPGAATPAADANGRPAAAASPVEIESSVPVPAPG
jgi:acetyl/propionyl-CoA carboxylase alpha subunit/acetyl-CoA carboxylase carboxyltransferase component